MCGVDVPWTETDDEHTLSLILEDSDGIAVAPPLQLGFKTGRSPEMIRGSSAHVPFAITGAFPFPAPGTYVVVATIDERPEQGRRLQFHVRLAGGKL